MHTHTGHQSDNILLSHHPLLIQPPFYLLTCVVCCTLKGAPITVPLIGASADLFPNQLNFLLNGFKVFFTSAVGLGGATWRSVVETFASSFETPSGRCLPHSGGRPCMYVIRPRHREMSIYAVHKMEGKGREGKGRGGTNNTYIYLKAPTLWIKGHMDMLLDFCVYRETMECP